MNVYVFAMPQQAYLNPMAWEDGSLSDKTVWAFSFFFVEDKFRTLFAMLFGAGIAMMIAKNCSGQWKRHVARMIVLFLIGLIHSVLLANNDILRGYAMAGLLLPFFVRFSAKVLLTGSALLMAVHLAGGLVFMGGFSPYLEQVQQLPSTNPAIARFAEQNYGSDPAAIAGSLQRGEESFGERVERRITRIPATTIFTLSSVPLNLAAMLVGVVLWKWGALSGGWTSSRLRKAEVRLALISLPALIVLA